ncbi:hypothetical protein [Streptomyces chartreusis]|uniref:hypothetical protein n=1 Tax=Streptomyces chartreusis TaxID=1969 RepID=UPI003624C9A8
MAHLTGPAHCSNSALSHGSWPVTGDCARATAVIAGAAAFSAVLAVAALAVPAAGADQDDSGTRFWNIDVNHDRDYTVGVEAARKRVFSVSATVSGPSGVRSVSYELWHGADRATADAVLVGSSHCVPLNETTSFCEALVTADPNTNLRSNALAGVWTITPWPPTAPGTSPAGTARTSHASSARPA